MAESNPFICHRWIQDVEGTFDTSKCPDILQVKFIFNLLRGRAKEWWNYTLAAKGPDVSRDMSWNEFKELFLQKFSPHAKLKNIRKDFLSTHQATQQPVHDFSMAFLDMARFLPEYVNDQMLLMNYYVDMLKKEIREFVSAKDWKNMDELMNAALEREQETKKRERSPPKRRIEQGGSSSKKFKSYETYPMWKIPSGPPPPPRQQEPRRNMNRRGAPPAPKPSGAPNLVGFQRPQRPPIEIDNEKFLIDLIPMPMGEIDVVITMDRLSKYDAIISCQNKLIRIRTLSEGETFIYGERKKTSLAIYTYARAKSHLSHGCQAYLAYIIDTQKSTPCLYNILVIREFPNVFPEEVQ
ncbi:reverse transcriptase domain-containing protein, partial [Tanacetum coccineum]